MRWGPHSGEGAVHTFLCCTAAFLLIIAPACLIRAQESSSQKGLPTIVMSGVPTVVVPDVRGQRAEDAEVTLRSAGLRPGTVSRRPGPGIVGTVLQQEPRQNSLALRGTAFNLVLVAPSSTSEPGHNDEEFTRQVPNLTGLTPNQASNLLERSKLMLSRVSAGNGNGREGTIYVQQPPQGTWVKVGSGIDVGIVRQQKTSGGPEGIEVLVPNLVGQQEKAAEEMLRQCGLSPGRIFNGRASLPPGTVFAQVPLPRTRLVQGTQVNVWVAEAPPPQETTVAVPGLLHRDISIAKQILARTDLQLGEAKGVGSSEPANSIIAQSPEASTKVERRTSVNVVIARPISLVAVPSIVQHDEAEAVDILKRAGLQLGAVTEMLGGEASGTVVRQQPQAGRQVRAGTAVDVVLSRLIGLTVMKDQSDPKIGRAVGFHAHLEPHEKGVKYKFNFGDNETTGWLTSSKTVHVYRKAGDFQVQASAAKGDITIHSDTVILRMPPPFSWVAAGALTAVILALGGAGYVYHGRKLFHRLIRVATKLDAGMQQVSTESRESWDPCVRVRLAQGAYESKVYLAGREQERNRP